MSLPSERKQKSKQFLTDSHIGVCMDVYSSKKAVYGMQFSRRGLSLAFQDNNENGSIQYSDHLGWSSRPNSQIGNPAKLKSTMPTFLSGRKATVNSYSRTTFTSTDKWKPRWGRQNTSSVQAVNVESSSRQEQMEGFKPIIRQKVMVNLDVDVDPTSAHIQPIFPESEVLQSSSFQGLSLNVKGASGEAASNPIARRPSDPKRGYRDQGASASSSVQYSAASRNATRISRPSRTQVTSMHRYGLRNLSCTSISDVFPSTCSPVVGCSKRMDASRKIYVDVVSPSRSKGTIRYQTEENPHSGVSSSATSKSTIRSLSEGDPDFNRSGHSGPNPSILERPLPQPTTRRIRNRLTNQDGLASVRSQRASGGDNRRRPFEYVYDNTFLQSETLMIRPPSQTTFSFNEAPVACSSQSFSTDLAPICQDYFGQSSYINRSAGTRRRGDPEENNTRVFCGSWMHRDGFRRANMEEITEVLFALERIEQDEALTYEELMVLESNLFFGGTGFHDQHRDMRMDIDNMSYEDLLALEEKMGTVSTALTEEALLVCLKRTIYTPTSGSRNTCVEDDVKCSICQEEYTTGDEVGKLHCDHHYHVTCIHQWLRQKNWCPICKSSACPS